jgi:hypothetical protein
MLSDNMLAPIRRHGLMGLGIRGVVTDEDVYDADSDDSLRVSLKRAKGDKVVVTVAESYKESTEHIQSVERIGVSPMKRKTGEEEKNAALMLMKLRVGDEIGVSYGTKRKRAASL